MAHPSLSRLLSKGEFPAVASKEAYERRIEELQRRMLLVQQGLFHSRGRAVIAFEGFDAAGKGGAIRRISEAVDPRGLRVVPIGPPGEDEQGRHWLWRFWRDLPLPGTITIFDRSWYGRVLVERVEQFCSVADWSRAYGEINDFEEQLHANHTVIVKFWLQISKDEQLRRFEERQQVPYKQHKITDEDWRNRDKWDAYNEAVCEMFDRTSTEAAPWALIGANNKYHARLEVLRTMAKAIEAAL